MKLLSWWLIICFSWTLFPSWAIAADLNSYSNSISNQSTYGIVRGKIDNNYRLGEEDQLEAHLIIGDNAMSLDYELVINQEGNIFFPNIGQIHLSGSTLKQAKQILGNKIRAKYADRFDLSLMVTKPKLLNIYVTGQIDRPGLFLVYDSARISDLLKEVGVAKEGSTLVEDVFLKRRDGSGDLKEKKLNLLEIFSNNPQFNIKLENGDIIAIPAIKSYVYVYGEVAKSGTFGYVPGQRISDYINVAGGPTAKASLGGVTVTRLEEGKPKVYRIDLSEIMLKGIKENDIEIHAGDVIQVPGNFFYFSDFPSFANTVLLALTLYNTVRK